MNKKHVNLTLALLLVSAQQTMAMYNPQTGRFLSRDPRGDLGFEVMQSASSAVLQNTGMVLNRQSIGSSVSPDVNAERGRVFERASGAVSMNEANSYHFVFNHPVDIIDPFGLLPLGFDKSKYNNCCCNNSMVQAGRNWLKNTYNSVERQLQGDNVPRRSSDPNYSCISINGYVLGQLDATPACWICWLERRERYSMWPVFGLSDHRVVICESLPLSGAGEKIVFDYWQNRNASDYSELESSWPWSYPRESYIGSYRDCTGTTSGSDVDRLFGRPPARP